MGCGDLKKEEIVQSKLSDSRFEVGCKLDVKSLKHIMTKRIDNDLNCLRNWLTLFTNVVKSDRPGEMGVVELKSFLDTGLGKDADIPDGMLGALEAVYELNYLIGSGEREYITLKQLNNLMDITISFNKEILPVYLDFSKSRKVKYAWHKERRREHYQSIMRITEQIKSKFNKKRANFDKVDLSAILDVFTTGDGSSMSRIKELLIVKKIILGGKSNILNYKELYELFVKLPAISSVLYDILKVSDIEFNGTIEVLDFANRALTNLGRDIIIKNKRGESKLFSIKELQLYFRKLYPKPLPLDFFKSPRLVKLIKEIFFGDGNIFTGIQLRKFISFTRHLGQKLQYFYTMYEENKSELDRLSPRGKFSLRGSKPANQQQIDYKKEFRQILERYLFFRGDKLSSIYARKTSKNIYGVFEYVALEAIGKKALKYWERKQPCDGIDFSKKERCSKEDYSGSLTKYQFRGFVGELAEFLVGAKIISAGRDDETADSIWDLADLFLLNSNGDSQIDHVELAEFGVLLFSAHNLSKLSFERTRLYCETNDKSEIEPSCFKKRFLKDLFRKGEKEDVSKYLPYLSRYTNKKNIKTQDLMVNGAVGFAQTCPTFKNGEPIFITPGDIFLMVAGMLNIESTMIRFDKNLNNQIDEDEFVPFAKVFDNAISITLKDELKLLGISLNFLSGPKIRRRVLRFMFKNYERPGAMDLLIREKKLMSTTDRHDFTSVLKMMSQTDPTPQADIDYCETLR